MLITRSSHVMTFTTRITDTALQLVSRRSRVGVIKLQGVMAAENNPGKWKLFMRTGDELAIVGDPGSITACTTFSVGSAGREPKAAEEEVVLFVEEESQRDGPVVRSSWDQSRLNNPEEAP